MQNSGLADAGRRTTIYDGKLVFQTGPRAGAGRDLTGPLSARRLAREPGWTPRRRARAGATFDESDSGRKATKADAPLLH